MSAGGKFIGLFVSLGLPRSRVGRLFASVEPGFVVGVVKGIQWAHERAVLGGGRGDTLRLAARRALCHWPLRESSDTTSHQNSSGVLPCILFPTRNKKLHQMSKLICALLLSTAAALQPTQCCPES